MSVETKEITADELLKMGDIGRCELIQGELIMMSPAGFWHGAIAARIARFLGAFVDGNELGIVLAAETGFKIETSPDTVRAPDASFVSRARLGETLTSKFFAGVPDLAAEVMSPGDNKREVIDKANMWLANGTSTVWIVDPVKMTISIHRVGAPVEVMTSGDVIQNEPLLPGFMLNVDEVFKRP